jgi:zinc transport system ATP-binding protein
MPLIDLRDIDFAYPGGQPVLSDLSLAVERGEFVAVAGPNGGGKTTLLRLVLGLLHPTRGHVRLECKRERIGYLAQRARLELDAPATVREVVTAGRAQRKLLGPLRAHDREAIETAIERVGLGNLASKPLARLSGGQQQRALIAKALAGDPELLVLDEPTTGVDHEAQESFAVLLGELHAELGATILYVSHEFGAVEGVVGRLLLVNGRIVFDGDPAELPAIWHDPSHVHP